MPLAARTLPIVLVTLAASFLGCGGAFAQVGGVGAAPMTATSPLAIGPGTAVGPTGIPFGATEMTTPGISPVSTVVPSMMKAFLIPGIALISSRLALLALPAYTGHFSYMAHSILGTVKSIE